MTDYTQPVYTRTVCNIAPEEHPHAELHENYMLSRRNREQVQTNPPVINTEGEIPIQSRAEDMPKQGFNGA